jgi:hypothetical protein
MLIKINSGVIQSFLQVPTVGISLAIHDATKAIKTCDDELFNGRLQRYHTSYIGVYAPWIEKDIACPRRPAPRRRPAS